MENISHYIITPISTENNRFYNNFIFNKNIFPRHHPAVTGNYKYIEKSI